MKKIIITVSCIVILLIIILVYLGVFSSCSTEECFVNALKSCSPVKYEKYQNSNLYSYKIYRSFGSDCKLGVELKQMAIGADLDLIDLLEGKEMMCQVPKDKMDDISKIDRLLNYCHGELKEGLQQVLLQRIYGLLMKGTSEIIDEASKGL